MTTPEPPLPNLLGFIADEDKEFQVSLARDRADITLWDQIQDFYEAPLREVKVHENEIPIFQVLTFSHYHFLTAMAALMRCHLSEMFGAVRIAIDAALIDANRKTAPGFGRPPICLALPLNDAPREGITRFSFHTAGHDC